MATPKVLPLLQPDTSLDLPKAFEQIAQEQAAQTQGIQNFGAAQDQNIQNIYGQLQGDLQKGVQTTQSIYGNAAGNIASAYDRAGTGGEAAAASNQGNIGEFASRLGMDPRALAEVQGRLAQQAATFEMRNRQSSANRQATMQQLGAGMASVAQLGVQAAQQAEAQGRTDLSRNIQSLLQKVATSAAAARTGFTQAKNNQLAKAAADAQKGILQAAKELAAEQRAAAREARSRAAAGPDWFTKFQLQNAENDRRYERDRAANAPIDDPFDIIWNDYMAQNFGPKATSYVEARITGNELKGLAKPTKGMNIPLLETYVRRLQGAQKKIR